MRNLLAALFIIAVIAVIWYNLRPDKAEEDKAPDDAQETVEFNIGFDTIRTDSQVVWRLLDQGIAESLRFYNAKPNQRGQRTGMILVGVNSDGVELNDQSDIGYIYLDESGAYQSISHEEAKRFANYVNQDRDISNMISEISKSNMPRDFDRMIIRPANYRDNQDSTYASVTLYTYAYSSPLQLTNELRTYPCPPVCADRWMYLYDPQRDELQQGNNDDDENGDREEQDEENRQNQGNR